MQSKSNLKNRKPIAEKLTTFWPCMLQTETRSHKNSS